MIMSGVRTTASRPAMPKRALRARVKGFKKWTTPQAGQQAPIDQIDSIIEPTPFAEPQPEPAAGVAPPIDWSRPFG